MAIENQILVVPVPGACAFVNAIIASGLDTREFSFYGFLPMHNKFRIIKLEEISKETKTSILYEAPHKLNHTLKELYEIIGDRKVVLAKELTKMHETFIRGSIQEIMQLCEEPKGEFIILIEKCKISQEEENIKKLNELTIEEHYKFYENKGLNKKEIIKQIAKDRNQKKNEIYQQFI